MISFILDNAGLEDQSGNDTSSNAVGYSETHVFTYLHIEIYFIKLIMMLFVGFVQMFV